MRARNGEDAQLSRAITAAGIDRPPEVEVLHGPAYQLLAALERDGWRERERHDLPDGTGWLRWFSRDRRCPDR